MPKKSPKTKKKFTEAKPTTGAATSAPKQATVASDSTPRKLSLPSYRSFKLEKKLPKPAVVKLPSGFRLFRQSLGLLKRNWKPFLGIVLIYMVLNLILVQGFFGLDLSNAKATAESALSGGWGKLAGGFSALTYLFGNSGVNQATSAYRIVLTVIGSLAIIWTLRQAVTGEKTRIRDGFYTGMYPLIPFILVFLVVSLQLIPITLTMYIYSVVGSTSPMEFVLWAAVFIPLVVLTFYMISSSIFALYIVCLPGMQPMAALRSAVQLVHYRRLFVLRRMLFLPLIIFIGLAVVMLPLIIFVPGLAVLAFFIFLMVILPIIHSYMYLLYRELLNEA